MLARGANPDNQDTNGNTTLHMLVIHNKLVISPKKKTQTLPIPSLITLKHIRCKQTKKGMKIRVGNVWILFMDKSSKFNHFKIRLWNEISITDFGSAFNFHLFWLIEGGL